MSQKTETDTMTDKSNPPPPGHINSPFFTKLPSEVRWMIYGEFFRGSRQEVVAKKEREDPNNRYTEFVRISMPRNRQFQLVQTCKAIYSECRNLYWSETAVKCGYMSFRTNLKGIPFYARECIRVLEGVATEDNFAPTNRIPLVQFLGYFPELEYCQLRHQTAQMYCHQNEVPPEDFLTEVGSKAFQDLARTLNANKPPMLVQRIYLRTKKDRDTVVWVYANHTHGRLHIAAKGSISDEEGFRMVTEPVKEAQKTDRTDDSTVEQHLKDFHEAIGVQKGLGADPANDAHDPSMTDDATEVDDVEEDDEEEKLAAVDNVDKGGDENEVYQVDE